MKTKNLVINIINAVLIAFGFICVALCFKVKEHRTDNLVYLAMYLLAAYYVFWGYKKPHGNVLKWTMFAFAFILIFFVNTLAKRASLVAVLFGIIAMGITAYVAGRLGKIIENMILLSISTVILLALTIYVVVKAKEYAPSIEFIGVVSMATPFLINAILCGAYFARFHDHKAAGVLDQDEVESFEASQVFGSLVAADEAPVVEDAPMAEPVNEEPALVEEKPAEEAAAEETPVAEPSNEEEGPQEVSEEELDKVAGGIGPRTRKEPEITEDNPIKGERRDY